jgi:hypothetical protein
MGLNGCRGEREVCRYLDKVDGVTAERNLNEQRSGNTGDVDSNIPIEVEVKCRKRPSPWKAIKEAQQQAERSQEDRRAVAMVRRKNGQGKPSDRIAVLSWEDFREMVRSLVESGAWDLDD